MLKPVYALLGCDSFLQLAQLRDLLKQLPDDVQRLDFDGERAELAEVLDELRSFAMFSEAKLVVLRDADAFITRFREQLEEYVAEPSTGAVLVLRLETLPANQRIHKAIAKVGEIINCNPPKDLARWVASHATTVHKIEIVPDACRLLVDLIGDSLGRLDSELSKLALYAEGGEIRTEHVNAMVGFQREQEMWDMTNAIAAGRTGEAIERWRHLVQLDSSAEFRAVTWLGMWLENVRKALALHREGKNPFAIAQQLRIWPREMQGPFFKTAEALGEDRAAHALDLLVEIDQQSKSGVGNAASNVERFILELHELVAGQEPQTQRT